MKCDWCGKETEVQSGLFVHADGKTRPAYDCCHGEHEGNPVFENKKAWSVWSKIHPILANRVLISGGPKYQYINSGVGDAWYIGCQG